MIFYDRRSFAINYKYDTLIIFTQLHIYHLISQCRVILSRIPPRRWPKKTETRKRLSIYDCVLSCL